MPISVQCPGCGKGLHGKDELAGKRVKCPKCGHEFAFPASGHKPSSSQTAPPIISPPRVASTNASEALPAPVTSPQRGISRYALYGSGAVVTAFLIAGVAFFVVPGKNRTPAKNEVAAGPTPPHKLAETLEPKTEHRKEDRPEPTTNPKEDPKSKQNPTPKSGPEENRKPEPKAEPKEISWQQDFDVFLDEMDKAVRAYNNDALDNFAKKTVSWKLKFVEVKETDKGPEIDFDLEPHGILKKAFESKHPVWVSFKPAASSLADWKKLKKGSLVTFQGIFDGAFLAQFEQPVKSN